MSIPVIDPTEFRRRVAGLTDPTRRPTGAAETLSVKEEAKGLCLIGCELFGESLARETLWDKIAAGLVASAAKCDDGDTDRFVSLFLDSIKADPAKAARLDEFTRWVTTMDARDEAYRQNFVRQCGQKAAVFVAHGRAAWEERKKLRQAAKGGAL